MSQEMQQRIQRLFVQDTIWSCAFVGALWLVVLYVFFSVADLTGDGAVNVMLVIGGGLVLLFNTAAIVAMIRHYSHEKNFIYGLDLRHLDAIAEAPIIRAAGASQ